MPQTACQTVGASAVAKLNSEWVNHGPALYLNWEKDVLLHRIIARASQNILYVITLNFSSNKCTFRPLSVYFL